MIGTTSGMLRRAGITRAGRVIAAGRDGLVLDGGTRIGADAVVSATGYRHDDRWIQIPGALEETGALILDGLDTPVVGLHAIGRPWQRSRGSALIGYVGTDARALTDRFARPGSVIATKPGPGSGRSATN